MQLQLREDPYHGFCVVVVRRGMVVRCHELPCDGQIDDFYNVRQSLDRYFWMDGPALSDRPDDYGELIAIRRLRSVRTYRPEVFRHLLYEVASVTFADRESYLRASQRDLDHRKHAK